MSYKHIYHSINAFWYNLLANIMSHLEVAMCSRSLGVNYSFRNAFTIEMGDLVDQIEILENDWTSRASCHRVLIVVNWVTT
jgi:hypothetical protein